MEWKDEMASRQTNLSEWSPPMAMDLHEARGRREGAGASGRRAHLNNVLYSQILTVARARAAALKRVQRGRIILRRFSFYHNGAGKCCPTKFCLASRGSHPKPPTPVRRRSRAQGRRVAVWRRRRARDVSPVNFAQPQNGKRCRPKDNTVQFKINLAARSRTRRRAPPPSRDTLAWILRFRGDVGVPAYYLSEFR
ncbi:hypothetical protein EVAR_95970_1 [Eumeta japonica]|uniref:Uncharacterized protein n=1 Tax=Eumeta variegata TaxID=151549 RepID=A0A4C1VB82_EUMVA|nr:hypothetical protein EVAR_95970_1 [Eumeta japonica]